MEENKTIKDLMTKEVVSVTPETPLIEAVNILLSHNFNGLPVLDENKRVAGILTEYDLTIKGSSIHLPTFLKLLTEFQIYKKDRGLISDDIKKILNMKVKDAMNKEPLLLKDNASLTEVADTFSKHHRVNPIPVVNDNGEITGIISRSDLIKLLGAASVHFDAKHADRDIDKNVNRFLNDFERHFVLVSKHRTRHWFALSAAFAIIGFIIAFMIIVRIR